MSDLNDYPLHTKYAEISDLKDEKADEKVSIERFLDVVMLSIGLGAYGVWINDKGGGKADALFKKGMQTGRRFAPLLSEGFDLFIAPLMERQDAAMLQQGWRKAMRPGAVMNVFANKGAFFGVLMPWLRRHQQILRDLFPGRSYQAALKIAAAVAEESPEATLHKLAAIPSVSGLRAIRKWNESAAKAVGASLTEAESVQADAESIQPVIEKIRTIQTELDVTDADTQEAADLAAQRAVLRQEIEEAAEESENPEAIRSTATSSLAEAPRSRIAEQAGLTPEQTKALLAEGKVLITAGAGSGKTRVLAAKVAYFVKEKGYRPEQIMATSFTRKSAMELKGRVEELFGIKEAEIGTTHSISGNIIRGFRPQWNRALNAAMNGTIDRIFSIAMVQVELSPSAGSGGYGGGGGYGGRGKSRGYRYAAKNLYKEALGQWFNLGTKIEDKKGKPIGKKRIKNFIGKWKMGGWGPDQAWSHYEGKREEEPTAYFAAAVYGAYEYLKNQDKEFAPAFDFDDWLLKATEILEEDPRALEAMQRRFKVVMVDEAQDLNPTQHKLFSLIAGKADTFAMIGDDKQAIYGFRGAVPEEFIDLPTEKNFEVESLTMNFRSGKEIVEAANRLIAHNQKQIPMVCEANVERKGMGQIKAVLPETHEQAAAIAASEISDSIKNGGMSPSDFGILVRNNAEADAYALALLAKGVPFRSSVDFFSKPIIKATLAWMRINTGGSDEQINDAVITAHQTPGFFLDKQFGNHLANQVGRGENYLDYLLGGGSVYPESWRDKKMVAPYVEALRSVMEFKGPASGAIRFIMGLQGSKMSFQDSLIEQIDADDLAEELGREPTEEDIEEAAFVPIRPILSVADNFADPAKMMDFIGKLKSANDTKRKDDEDPEPAVMIGTVHKWKGLEAKHVYVSMAGGVFPPPEDLLSQEQTSDPIIRPQTIEDERRLAYVALTRGEDSVTVLSPTTNYKGKEGGMSTFIAEACIGIEGEVQPEENPDAEEDSPPVSRTASKERFNFAAALGAFDTIEEDPFIPDSELEASWK